MAAPIMMVLDGCSSNRDHLLVANTLMQLKRNVCLVRGCGDGRDLRVTRRVVQCGKNLNFDLFASS